ncbi:hypothetical protein G5I_06329 [Acromyrmex echinatior]|uniref:Uncharacterized protein n=1 Tax=Acromyrmex echinatior TaxID=103372 RepID=F4WKQ9_ACREC|nr:hypothetical protein G5I_06329 [Acromyrmex echinatior]
MDKQGSRELNALRIASSWGSRGGGGSGMIAGSPGVGGMSNSSSSSGASWRSGTPSPPLSEEGVPTRSSPCPATSHPSHNQPHYPYNTSGSSSSSTPGSTTLDEGIVPDYIEEQHPRKKIRAKVNQDPIETEPGACATFESEQYLRVIRDIERQSDPPMLKPQKLRIVVDVSQILLKRITRQNIHVHRHTSAYGPRSQSGNTREDPAAPLVHRVAVHTT